MLISDFFLSRARSAVHAVNFPQSSASLPPSTRWDKLYFSVFAQFTVFLEFSRDLASGPWAQTCAVYSPAAWGVSR